MEGDIIQYEVLDNDFTMKSTRINRRRIDDKKSTPHKPGTSCFRKGYHKYNRDWKKSCRRSDRRNSNRQCNQYMMTDHPFNWDVIEEFAWDIKNNSSGSDEFYLVKTVGYDDNWVYVDLDRYFTEYDDEIEEYYDEYYETVCVWFTYRQLIRWGLVD